MKSKQFLILLAVAAVLVVAGFLVQRGRKNSWGGSAIGQTVLPDVQGDKVAKVTVKGAEGTVSLALKDGKWRVAERYDYPAKVDTLRELLRDAMDLKAIDAMEVGESQYGRLGLNEPGTEDGGTALEFTDKDGKTVCALRLGKEHMKDGGSSPNPMGMGGMGGGWPDGRYVLVPGRDTVYVVAKTFSAAAGDASQWIDKEFFKVADLKEGVLTEGDSERWKVSRETKDANLNLAGEVPEGKEVDTGKLGSIKTAFSWASFTDVADPAMTPEQTGMDNPKVYVARDFDGFAYTVKVGKKTDDGKYYLAASVAYEGPAERTPADGESPEDKTRKDEEFAKALKENREKAQTISGRLEGWVYLVNSYTVESVLKSRDELLKDKPKPKEENAPAAAEGGTAVPGPGAAE